MNAPTGTDFDDAANAERIELRLTQRAAYGWETKPTHKATHGEYCGEYRFSTIINDWVHGNDWVKAHS